MECGEHVDSPVRRRPADTSLAGQVGDRETAVGDAWASGQAIRLDGAIRMAPR